MSATIVLPNTVPLGFVFPNTATTAKSIVKKDKIEIQPANYAATYSYASNGRLQFNVSTNSAFLDGPESYIRCDFAVTLTAALTTYLATATGYDLQFNEIVALDVGGIHSCIRNMTISSVSQSTRLEYSDLYNFNYAIKSCILENAMEVDQTGWVYGDSIGLGYQGQLFDRVIYLQRGLDYNPATAVTVTGGANIGIITVTVLAGTVYSYDIQPGDMVYIELSTVAAFADAAVSYSYEFMVTTITSTTIVGYANGSDISAGANKIRNMFVRKRDCAAIQARTQVCNTLNHVLEWRPNSAILKHVFPLFLMKSGLFFDFELENPVQCLRLLPPNHLDASYVTSAVTYFLANAYFVATLITPHPNVMDIFVDQWNTERGLIYPIPSYICRPINGTAGAQSEVIRFNIGARSVRRINVVQVDQNISEANTMDTLCNFSKSTWLRGGVKEYQFQIGAHNFPNNKVITLYNVPQNGKTYATATEPFQQTMIVNGATTKHARMNREDWASIHNYSLRVSGVDIVNETAKFIMSVDLSRDNYGTGYLTGQDTSQIPTQLTVDRTEAYNVNTNGRTNQRYIVNADIDQFITMNAQGVVILT